MTYLICYDISDDRLRNRLAKHLEKAGCIRLQKSVFVAPDFDLRRLLKLRGTVQRLLPPQLSWDESVIVIPIEKDNLQHITWAGHALRIEGLLQKFLFKIV